MVHTNLTLSGAVAQYGRGIGMIQATAAALMKQFANNLKKQLAQSAGGEAPEAKPISAPSLAGQVMWNSLKRKPISPDPVGISRKPSTND